MKETTTTKKSTMMGCFHFISLALPISLTTFFWPQSLGPLSKLGDDTNKILTVDSRAGRVWIDGWR